MTTADVTKAQLTGFLLGGGPIVCHRGQSRSEGDRRNYPTGRHYNADHTGDGHDRRSERDEHRWSSSSRGLLACGRGGGRQKAE